MNFKKIMAVASVGAFVLASSAAYAKTMEFTLGSTSLYISDKGITKAEIETAPYTESGRTMVPIRIISENFGANVSWNEETSEVTVEDSQNKIVLTLGKNEAVVNGVAVALDVPAKEIGGRTMVPLRFVAENLGKGVSYVDLTEQVLISDEKPIITVNGKNYTIDDYRYVMGDTSQLSESEVIGLVNRVHSLFVEIGSVSASAENEGFDIDDSLKSEIKEMLNSYGDEFYSYCLKAPVARISLESERGGAYLNEKSELATRNVDINEIYNSEYVKANHILILTQDSVTGEAFDEKGKADAKKLAEDILKKLKKGEDFNKLCDEYTEDPGHATYPDGYVFTKGEMVKEFEDAAYSLKEGEISGIVETSYGYHILKRLPLPEMDYEVHQNMQYNITYQEFNKLYDECVNNADVEIHMTDEEVAKLIKN